MSEKDAAAVRGEIAEVRRYQNDLARTIHKSKKLGVNTYHLHQQVAQCDVRLAALESELSALGGAWVPKVGDRVKFEGTVTDVGKFITVTKDDGTEGCFAPNEIEPALRPAAPAPADATAVLLDLTEAWHKGDGDKPLHEYLGFTWEQWCEGMSFNRPVAPAVEPAVEAEPVGYANFYSNGAKGNIHKSIEDANRFAQLDLPDVMKCTEVAVPLYRHPAPVSDTKAEPVGYGFDRYINGELMAEGVVIERQATLSAAAREAARIAPRGPNGEAPVLVYRHPTPDMAAASPVTVAPVGVVAAPEKVVEAINNLFRNTDLLVELADEDTDSEDFAGRLDATKEALLEVKPLLAGVVTLPEPSEWAKEWVVFNNPNIGGRGWSLEQRLDLAAALIAAAQEVGE